MLLTACERPEPKIVDRPYAVTPYVPESVRTCPPIPKSYDYVKSGPDEEAWQSEVAGYITDLHETARTCKSNLGAVDSILDDAEENAGPR